MNQDTRWFNTYSSTNRRNQLPETVRKTLTSGTDFSTPQTPPSLPGSFHTSSAVSDPQQFSTGFPHQMQPYPSRYSSGTQAAASGLPILGYPERYPYDTKQNNSWYGPRRPFAVAGSYPPQLYNSGHAFGTHPGTSGAPFGQPYQTPHNMPGYQYQTQLFNSGHGSNAHSPSYGTRRPASKYGSRTQSGSSGTPKNTSQIKQSEITPSATTQPSMTVTKLSPGHASKASRIQPSLSETQPSNSVAPHSTLGCVEPHIPKTEQLSSENQCSKQQLSYSSPIQPGISEQSFKSKGQSPTLETGSRITLDSTEDISDDDVQLVSENASTGETVEVKTEDVKPLVDCIDLCDDVDSSEEQLNRFHYETRTQILQQLCGTLDEGSFLEALRQFKIILENQTAEIRMKYELMHLLTRYVLFLGINYEAVACGFVEEYLDLMEDIIALYCQVVREFIILQIGRKKRRNLRRLAARIKSLMARCLLYRMDSILHCLFKVHLYPYEEEVCFMWTDIFLYFLNKVKCDFKNDDLLRAFIAWQKLKTIRAPSDADGVDEAMCKKFGRQIDELRSIPRLKNIIDKMRKDSMYCVRNMLEEYWRWWNNERPTEVWTDLEEPTTMELPGDSNVEYCSRYPSVPTSSKNMDEVAILFEDRRSGKNPGLHQLAMENQAPLRRRMFFPGISNNSPINIFDSDDDSNFPHEDSTDNIRNDLVEMAIQPKIVGVFVIDSSSDDDDDDVICLDQANSMQPAITSNTRGVSVSHDPPTSPLSGRRRNGQVLVKNTPLISDNCTKSLERPSDKSVVEEIPIVEVSNNPQNSGHNKPLVEETLLVPDQNMIVSNNCLHDKPIVKGTSVVDEALEKRADTPMSPQDERSVVKKTVELNEHLGRNRADIVPPVVTSIVSTNQILSCSDDSEDDEYELEVNQAIPGQPIKTLNDPKDNPLVEKPAILPEQHQENLNVGEVDIFSSVRTPSPGPFDTRFLLDNEIKLEDTSDDASLAIHFKPSKSKTKGFFDTWGQFDESPVEPCKLKNLETSISKKSPDTDENDSIFDKPPPFGSWYTEPFNFDGSDSEENELNDTSVVSNEPGIIKEEKIENEGPQVEPLEPTTPLDVRSGTKDFPGRPDYTLGTLEDISEVDQTNVVLDNVKQRLTSKPMIEKNTQVIDNYVEYQNDKSGQEETLVIHGQPNQDPKPVIEKTVVLENLTSENNKLLVGKTPEVGVQLKKREDMRVLMEKISLSPDIFASRDEVVEAAVAPDQPVKDNGDKSVAEKSTVELDRPKNGIPLIIKTMVVPDMTKERHDLKLKGARQLGGRTPKDKVEPKKPTKIRKKSVFETSSVVPEKLKEIQDEFGGRGDKPKKNNNDIAKVENITVQLGRPKESIDKESTLVRNPPAKSLIQNVQIHKKPEGTSQAEKAQIKETKVLFEKSTEIQVKKIIVIVSDKDRSKSMIEQDEVSLDQVGKNRDDKVEENIITTKVFKKDQINFDMPTSSVSDRRETNKDVETSKLVQLNETIQVSDKRTKINQPKVEKTPVVPDKSRKSVDVKNTMIIKERENEVRGTTFGQKRQDDRSKIEKSTLLPKKSGKNQDDKSDTERTTEKRKKIDGDSFKKKGTIVVPEKLLKINGNISDVQEITLAANLKDSLEQNIPKEVKSLKSYEKHVSERIPPISTKLKTLESSENSSTIFMLTEKESPCLKKTHQKPDESLSSTDPLPFNQQLTYTESFKNVSTSSVQQTLEAPLMVKINVTLAQTTSVHKGDAWKADILSDPSLAKERETLSPDKNTLEKALPTELEEKNLRPNQIPETVDTTDNLYKDACDQLDEDKESTGDDDSCWNDAADYSEINDHSSFIENEIELESVIQDNLDVSPIVERESENATVLETESWWPATTKEGVMPSKEVPVDIEKDYLENQIDAKSPNSSDEISPLAFEALDKKMIQQYLDQWKKQLTSTSKSSETDSSTSLSTDTNETTSTSTSPSVGSQEMPLLNVRDPRLAGRTEIAKRYKRTLDASNLVSQERRESVERELAMNYKEQVAHDDQYAAEIKSATTEVPECRAESPSLTEPIVQVPILAEAYTNFAKEVLVDVQEEISADLLNPSIIDLASPGNHDNIIIIGCRNILEPVKEEDDLAPAVRTTVPPSKTVTFCLPAEMDYDDNRKTSRNEIVVAHRRGAYDEGSLLSGSQPYSPQSSPSTRISNVINTLEETNNIIYSPFINKSRTIQPSVVPDVPLPDSPKEGSNIPKRPTDSPSKAAYVLRVTSPPNKKSATGTTARNHTVAFFEEKTKKIYDQEYGSGVEMENNQNLQSRGRRKVQKLPYSRKDSEVKPFSKPKKKDQQARTYKPQMRHVTAEDNDLFQNPIEGPVGKPLRNTGGKAPNMLWDENEESGKGGSISVRPESQLCRGRTENLVSILRAPRPKSELRLSKAKEFKDYKLPASLDPSFLKDAVIKFKPSDVVPGSIIRRQQEAMAEAEEAKAEERRKRKRQEEEVLERARIMQLKEKQSKPETGILYCIFTDKWSKTDKDRFPKYRAPYSKTVKVRCKEDTDGDLNHRDHRNGQKVVGKRKIDSHLEEVPPKKVKVSVKTDLAEKKCHMSQPDLTTNEKPTEEVKPTSKKSKVNLLSTSTSGGLIKNDTAQTKSGRLRKKPSGKDYYDVTESTIGRRKVTVNL